MAKVSIIIPVYNVITYLRKCLNSVLAQTLFDIEIICVDDGSTDGSQMLLDEYARCDNRIVVIHKENGGYGQAMNVGLEVAKGEYIGIVESDDLILPMMYETLYERAKLFNLDIVKSDFYYYWEVFNHWEYCKTNEHKQYYNVVLTQKDREQMFLFWMFTWTGIYRRSFLVDNEIRWNESPGASFQDNGFWIQTMAMAGNSMWIDTAFYFYRQDNPLSSMKDKAKMCSMKKEYDRVEQILANKNMTEEIKISNYFRLQEHIVTYRRIADGLKSNYKRIILDEFEKYKDECRLLRGDITTDWVIQDILHILKDSEKIVRRKQEIEDKLKNAKHVLIYGAGRKASEGWKRLFFHGYTDKIDMVVETDPNIGKIFWGRRVFRLDEYTGDKNTTLVIIAVGERFYSEIKTIVQEEGYECLMNIDDVCENLWAI